MKEVYLSKSRYCKCIQCKKILWLKKYKPEVSTPSEKDAVFENGYKVGELAKGLFGKYENVDYNEDLNIMVEKTKKLLEKNERIITEASFNFNNNFCSVDILKNDLDGLEIYEVKSATKMHDIYIDDASYQYYILTSLGFNVKKVCIVHINNQYVREEKLDLNQLFNIVDITKEAISKKDEIGKNIIEFNDFYSLYNKDNEPDIDISPNCKNPYLCDFWGYCTRNLPKPNIFDLSILGNKAKKIKFEKYYEGKISFEDLQNERLSPSALEQINFELNDLEPKVNREEIKQILDSLKYPLYFLDYETYQVAIPEIVGTKPYQQLPSQYSLHIIREEGAEIKHKEFLAQIDDKDFIRHFAESLINDIDEDGSVIIYNKSFEPARNREISKMYPDLKEELERINSNMVDFLEPFNQRKIYLKEMQGSASIKYVLPALYPDDPELNYSNLPIVHNGKQASETFLNLKNQTKEEQEKNRNGLLVYCKLDTYAMVKVWKKFKEIVKD